jgi:3-oxoacyl-(acyl-carrier-protein) synthase
MREVYIGAVGLVSAAGNNVEEHLRFNGFSDNNIPLLDYSTLSKRLSSARKMVKFMSTSAILMELAATEAMQNVAFLKFDLQRIGLYAATGLAGGNLNESMNALKASCDQNGISIERFNSNGLKAINPLMSFHVLANIPGCIVSVIHNIKGDNLLFSPFEDQGANALFEGFYAVANLLMDAALVLSGDDPAHPANLAYLKHNKIFSDSDIPNPAGAAVFFTSSPENALARVESMSMEYCDSEEFFDPLCEIFGRTVTSSALMQFILSASAIDCPNTLVANGQRLRWRLAYE